MNEITNHQISQAILSDFEYWSGIEGENIAIKNSSSMLTYKELNDLSNKTARLLLESNPDHNEPVVVICNDDLNSRYLFSGSDKSRKNLYTG